MNAVEAAWTLTFTASLPEKAIPPAPQACSAGASAAPAPWGRRVYFRALVHCCLPNKRSTMTNRDLQFSATAGNTLLGLSLIPLPPTWLAPVETQLAADEKVLAWLEIDLTDRLTFPPGLVALTNHRLLAKSVDDKDWQSHSLRDGLT